MLTKNLSSSDLTNKIKTRMQFANYIIQQQAVANGCLGRITVEGGSGGTKPASIFTDIKEGQAYTTGAEQAAILANNQCPPAATSTSSGGGSGPTPPDPTGSTGQNLWGVSLYSSTATNQNGVLPYASAVDTNGNIYVAGSYNNAKFTVNSYSSTNSGTKVITQSIFGQLPTTTVNASFITKYNSSGVAQWATSVTATTSCDCYNVAADSDGNVYSLHTFQGTATVNSYTSRVDGGDITLTAYGTVAASGVDLLLVKHNSSGEVQWVAQITGQATESSQFGNSKNIAVDSNNNLCFTFTSTGTSVSSPLLTFNSFSSGGGGGSVTFSTFGTYNAGKSRSIYICKINSSGIFQWVSEVRPINTAFAQPNYSCAVDSNNNVYTAFTCYTSASSDGFNLQSYNGLSGTAIQTTKWASVATLLGTIDGFVAKLNSDGAFQLCARLGNVSRSVSSPSIAVDSNNRIIATFKYSSDVTYDDASKINIYSAGGKDGADNVVFTAWASLPVRGVTASTGADTSILIFNSSLVAQSATYFYSADIVSPGRSCQIYSVDRDGNNNIFVNVYFNGANLTINTFDSLGTGGLDNNINVSIFATIANTSLSTFDCALVKFQSSLTAEWATRINDVAITESLIPYSLSVDKTSGAVYTSGMFPARDTGGVRFQNYTAVSGGAVSLTLGGQINSSATTATSIRQAYLAKY